MAYFTCENLSYGYETGTVIEDLNFTVNAGDYLCIVGENGSGKSTLIKGLLGLKAPQSGRITVADGLNQRSIGYLPQQTPVQRDFPASVMEVVLSGRLSVQKGFHPFYTKRDKADAIDKMEKLSILDLKNKCYRDLSGGQQQRVLLARALCATEKLLLLDEPVTGLDPLMTADFYKLIAHIHRRHGVTVIMVSHDMESALRYATHILHLGKTQLFFGTAEEYACSSAGKKFLQKGEDL